MKTQVYADHAAATPTDPRVIKAMEPFWTAIFGNPSSLHTFGRQAAAAVDTARQTIADFIGADTHEVYFTATGTESNNLAILGVARANKTKGRHIITTQIEHPSILNACRALEKDGWHVTYLPVDQNGQISFSELDKAITAETILLSIHYGNSELGTLPDIEKITAICRSKNVLVHVDACQAMSFEPVDVNKMSIDLLTFNGSKMYGPKGVAVLYVRSSVSIFPIMYGGGQQQSLRSGTENVPGIIGLAEAAKISAEECNQSNQQVGQLRDQLQSELEKLPNVIINAQSARRLPNHLSVTLGGIKNQDLVALMDAEGIAVASGSACSSKSITDSHVLTAIGLTSEQAQATIRISLGRRTTAEDCQKILKAIKKILS